MFHAIRSLLALEREDAKTHAGALALFSKHFVVSAEKFSKKDVADVMYVQSMRSKGDYVDYYLPTPEEVRRTIELAKSFVKKVQLYLAANDIKFVIWGKYDN